MERLTYKDYFNSYLPKNTELNKGWFTKLGKLEDLEEELGIDLITLFKALKEGIYHIESDDFFKRPRLYYSNDFNCWCFELGLGAYVVRLKDYGKTWSLTKEEFEDEN